jgi:hypothetical protein
VEFSSNKKLVVAIECGNCSKAKAGAFEGNFEEVCGPSVLFI